MEQILAIAFVFALLGCVVWVFGRRGGGLRWPGRQSGKEQMTCMARLPLTAQHTLHLVTVAGRTILVATFPGGVRIDRQDQPFSAAFAEALPEDLRQ